jgi:uncharacterized repeat protein (TIGR03943 family)
VNRPAQGLVLLVLGGAVLRAGLTDVYLRYVRAGLKPYLLVTGVVLIVAALATLWYEWQASRSAGSARSAEPAPEPEPAPEHHHHHEPRIAWLLVLPLFALVVVVPPALGSFAADRAGTVLRKPFGYPTLPAGDPIRLEVLDYATRAVYDHGRSLTGRRVEITGFVTTGGHGTPYLTRMVLNCCAADAQPVKVALTGKIPPTLAGSGKDTWVDVIGTWTPRRTKDEINSGVIPYIEVSQARVVAAPSDEYEE